MKSIITLLLSSILLASLVGCQPDKGKPMIPEKQMADLLTEYYLMQATIAQFNVGKEEGRSYYYYQLLEKHGYTEAEFDSAVVWYTQNLDVFEKVYNRTHDRLQTIKDSLAQLMATMPAIPDSVKSDSAQIPVDTLLAKIR